MSAFNNGPKTKTTDFTSYTDEQLANLANVYQRNIDEKRGNTQVYTQWLSLLRDEQKFRAAGQAFDDTSVKLGAPDLGTMNEAGAVAAMKQRKRTAKYATLIEGQNTVEQAAASQPAVLNRKRATGLIGY